MVTAHTVEPRAADDLAVERAKDGDADEGGGFGDVGDIDDTVVPPPLVPSAGLAAIRLLGETDAPPAPLRAPS